MIEETAKFAGDSEDRMSRYVRERDEAITALLAAKALVVMEKCDCGCPKKPIDATITGGPNRIIGYETVHKPDCAKNTLLPEMRKAVEVK